MVLVPIERRWLESGKALALRTPLAGLLKFVAALRSEKSRVPASGGRCLRSFEPKFDLNRPMRPPLVRPPDGPFGEGDVRGLIGEVGQAGVSSDG